jgi:hypothetical protein
MNSTTNCANESITSAQEGIHHFHLADLSKAHVKYVVHMQELPPVREHFTTYCLKQLSYILAVSDRPMWSSMRCTTNTQHHLMDNKTKDGNFQRIIGNVSVIGQRAPARLLVGNVSGACLQRSLCRSTHQM